MKDENKNKYFRIRTRGKKTRFYVDNELVEKSEALGLRPNDIATYCAIARHAHSKDQSCFPRYETIMNCSRVKNRGTLSRCLKKLEALNIIEIHHSPGRKSNVYRLSDPICWKYNSGKSGTVGDKKHEPYQNKHTNSITYDPNRINVDTLSHSSKSDNINHKNIDQIKKELSDKFSIERVRGP